MSPPEPLPLPVAVDADPAPTLWQLSDVRGPGDAVRDVHVAVPAGIAPTSGRPVVYLQDGQNLFDPERSYAGHWALLETLARHPGPDTPIVVGIPNLGLDRLREYSPFDDVLHGPGGAAEYLAFVRDTVKPLVDASFATRPGRDWTAVGGSSMGGLFALYALIAGAGTFGSAWVMSPAFWYADGAIYDWMAHQPGPVGRIWLDAGEDEGVDELHDTRRMRDLLVARGWRLGESLHYLEDPDGDHDEASWARRVADGWPILTRLFGPSRRRRTTSRTAQ